MSDVGLTGNEHFERAYLAAFLRDQDFFAYVFEDINKQDQIPKFFPNPTAQRVARMVCQFGGMAGTCPDTLIYQELDKIKTSLAGELYSSIKAYLDGLFEIPLRDQKYLLNEHDSFIKGQLVKGMLPKLVTYGQKGDHKAIEGLMKEYLEFRPRGMLAPGIEHTSYAEDRIQRRIEAEDAERYYLMIPPIDEKGFYIGPRDLMVVQSQKSSVGKTTTLCNIVRNLCMQGIELQVYTLEEDEAEFQDRLDQAITWLLTDELKDRAKMEMKLKHWIDNKCRIKEFDAYDTRVSDLIAHHNMMREYYGYKPKVIIINAGDDLIADRGNDNLFATGRDVYRQLKSWAKRDWLAIITDAQSTRGAAEKAVADQADMGTSIAKVQLATHIISLNRSPEEVKANMTTINVVKNRKGLANYTVTFHSDMARGQLYVKPQDD